MAEEQETASTKKQRTRSPSYPYIDLKTAVERAEKLWKENGKHGVDPEIAATLWGYSKKSSGGRQTLAALGHYGLIERDGGNVKLSERALDIVMPGSPKRSEALKAAALAPKAFRELWSSRGADLGLVPQLEFELVRTKGYNQNAVGGMIENYRQTIAYAGLKKSGNMPSDEQAPDGLGAKDTEGESLPATGDLIQWTSQGVDMFPTPRRVSDVVEHKGAHWVWVEGSGSAVLASEVTVVKKAKEPSMEPTTATPETALQGGAPTPPPPPPRQEAHADTYVLTIPYKGKLLSVRVSMPGEDLEKEHFDKIIKHLELLTE